jgi:hypothetical protein
VTAPTEPLVDPIVDPIGSVVAMVAAADPTLRQDTIRQIAEQVGGGRAKRRRLAVALADDPSVLVTGRSPAPKVVGELLLALRRADAARISPPWCADCGREVTSMQRRGADWYCCPCFVRPQACAGCGQERQVAFRDRHGRPRCIRCPDQDASDPHRVLVEVITAIEPALPADAVAAAIEATVTKAAHLQKLAWVLQDAPELLTGDGARAPFPMVLRLIDALCDAGATRIRRLVCPRCQRVVALSKQRDGLRICRGCCARARAVACARCGTVREPAARDPNGQPLCPHCLVSDPINLEACVGCGRRRRVSTRTADGPRCQTCTPRTTMTCSICGTTRPCTLSKATGQPWCAACARSWARCAGCGRLAPVRAGTRDAPLCGTCAVPDADRWKACPTCGTPGRLIAGACRRCHLHQQLGDLLADPTGHVRPELQALHQALASVERPATVLNWLARNAPRTVLVDLAAGRRPLSHAALDELPASKPLAHLRSILVAAGALPARDEHLAQLERWTTRLVAARADPDERQLLHRYAVWHVLRRLRARTRDAHTTHQQATTARRRIAAAAAFLDWLGARDTTLVACTQADLDAWMATASRNQRGQTGAFVRWARNQRLTRLDFPATRWAGPAGVIDAEARWQQARWLLRDDTLNPEDRVAGLLVLLYAQQPAAIGRLTIDHVIVDAADGQVRLRLGREPVVLPDPLVRLVLRLVATRHGHATIGELGTSRWLLPGGRPGQPISAYQLTQRLHQLGVHPAQARSTALFQLATELPAAILARLLGLHISVAVQWQHAAAGDWTGYAAEVSRRNGPAQHHDDQHPPGRGRKA